MSVKCKVRIGGLMRCCLASLDDYLDNSDTYPSEGDLLACAYHPEKPVMIFRADVWEWIGPQ